MVDAPPDEKPEDTVSPRRSRLHSRQWGIAKKALSFLFDGKITSLSTRGLHRQVRLGKGVWRLEKLQSAISFREGNTGPDLGVDHVKIHEETAWIIVSRTLAAEGLSSVALAVAYRYLDVSYDLQTDLSNRIYKAEPLFSLSEILRNVGEMQLAKGCMLLSYLEDLLYDHDPHSSRAYDSLLQLFVMPEDTLDGIAKYASELDKKPLFPDEVLVQWELDNAPRLSLLYPKR